MSEIAQQKRAPIVQWQPGTKIEAGIYLGMPEEIYFAHHAVSVSGLKEFARAPARFKYGQRQTTPSQSIGKLWHTALLEPSELKERFAPTTCERRGTNEWKREQIIAGDRELIKQDSWGEMEAMRASIESQGGPLLDVLNFPEKIVEASFFWTDWPTGIHCRGRADVSILEHGFTGDVKSCQDADEDFKFAVRDYLYHWQAAFYKRGLRTLGYPIEDFVFFAIEKTRPYLYRPWIMPQEAVRRAENKIIDLLPKFKMCLETGEWPGYPSDIAVLPYPDSWLDYE